MANTRFAQWQAVNDAGFKGMIEASLMVVADRVRKSSSSDPNYVQRVGLANRLSSEFDNSEYIRLFCWWAVNVPAVQNLADVAGAFTPKNITDEVIDAAVMAFWDTAANVPPEPAAPVVPVEPTGV